MVTNPKNSRLLSTLSPKTGVTMPEIYSPLYIYRKRDIYLSIYLSINIVIKVTHAKIRLTTADLRVTLCCNRNITTVAA